MRIFALSMVMAGCIMAYAISYHAQSTAQAIRCSVLIERTLEFPADREFIKRLAKIMKCKEQM